jgi:hypothetical protein
VQVRSTVGEPGVASTKPLAQGVHAVHAGAFAAVLKVPAAQAVQARSTVGEPAVDTYWPAAQVLHGVQVEALVVAV